MELLIKKNVYSHAQSKYSLIFNYFFQVLKYSSFSPHADRSSVITPKVGDTIGTIDVRCWRQVRTSATIRRQRKDVGRQVPNDG